MLGPADVVQEAAPGPPADSISAAIARWKPGHFRDTFLHRTLEMGNSDDGFLAAKVLSADQSLYLLGRKLGEGEFGSVSQVAVPKLGKSYALKTVKAVSAACNQMGHFDVVWCFVLWCALLCCCNCVVLYWYCTVCTKATISMRRAGQIIQRWQS